MSTPPLRIALVGAGAMGSLHARVVTQSQDAVLSAVVDPSESSGRAIAEEYRTSWTPDIDDLGAFDAVIVASPTPTHISWVHRVLSAGKPVLVEKPISLDIDETRAIAGEARRLDVPLACGFLERFSPVVTTALEIVSEPVHVSVVRHSPYAARIATGVAHDLLIHDVDLVLRMAGRRPDSLMAHFSYCHPKSEPDAEDIAEVTLRYDAGLLASLSASRVSQRKVRTLHIVELERLVEVDMLRQDITVYRHIGNEFVGEDGRGYRQQTIMDIPTLVNTREPLATQFAHFVALARGECDHRAELEAAVAPHEVLAEAMQVATTT